MIVSVVIPVYNVKLYLERCVQSVLCQTYRDLEIILVDDGSTDGSGKLCDTIAEHHKNMVVVHQENRGLSEARNTGIRKATGDYIIFLDSDDTWLLDNGLDILLKDVDKTLPDLIVFKRVDIWQDGRRTHASDYDAENIARLPDGHSVFQHLVITQQFNMSACFLLARRQILISNDILFPVGFISEDLYWSLHLWQHVQKVVVTNLEFYGYNHHENSLTTTATIHVYESYDKIFGHWKTQCDAGCKNANAIRIYLANMWVSRGYAYYQLKPADKPAALTIMKRHADLLYYAVTPKGRRVQKLVKLFGVGNAINLLGYYWRLRTWVQGHA